MSAWLILFVGVIYVLVGVKLIFEAKIGLGVAFLGYAAANVGLYMEALK